MSYTKVLEQYCRIHCFGNFLNQFLGFSDVKVIIILITENKILWGIFYDTFMSPHDREFLPRFHFTKHGKFVIVIK